MPQVHVPDAIDTFNETVISLEDAAKHVSELSGKPRNRNLIVRWISRGCGGVRLAAIRIGSEIFTSKEALNTFLNRRNRPKKGDQSAPVAHSQADNQAITELGI